MPETDTLVREMEESSSEDSLGLGHTGDGSMDISLAKLMPGLTSMRCASWWLARDQHQIVLNGSIPAFIGHMVLRVLLRVTHTSIQ